MYYWGAIEVANWKFNTKEIIYKIPGTEQIIIGTDVNYWEGSFTGKDDINSLQDLTIPANQEKVIREIVKFNYNSIKKLLEGSELLDVLLSPNTKALTKNGLLYTASGILAAAHLIGAWGTSDFILKGIKACDEFGTKIEKYLEKFSYYSIQHIS